MADKTPNEDPRIPAADVKSQADISPDQQSAATATGAAMAAVNTVNARAGYYRWTICALLFFSTTINYVDRAIIGLLGPNLKEMFVENMVKAVPAGTAVSTAMMDEFKKQSELDFGRVNLAFTAAYAIGMLLAGRFMDRFGTRLGLALAVALWSLAGMGHAAARTVFGFAVARFALGLAEAGNFPAAIKTVADWFPKRERALATGVFNAGSNVGAILAPLVVPWLATNYGWQAAFLVTGAVGFLWLIFWLPIFRLPEDHPKVSKGELAYIRSDPAEPTTHIPWKSLFPFRQTWAFALGKLMTDPVWWFFLFWTPSFFKQNFGYGLDRISLPMIIIYLAADVGSVGGGWLSSSFLKRGWSQNAARKIAMLICAACVLPVWIAGVTTNVWLAVGVISLALAAHQGWSANLFTLVSDTFPRRAVGSVVGIGGMAGALGGLFMSEVVGQALKRTGQYMPMFIAASVMYLITLLVIHLLNPRLRPVGLDEKVAT